jgi:hypothetical protein
MAGANGTDVNRRVGGEVMVGRLRACAVAWSRHCPATRATVTNITDVTYRTDTIICQTEIIAYVWRLRGIAVGATP